MMPIVRTQLTVVWRRFVCLMALAPIASVFAAEERVNFNRDIRPILSDKCFACHGLDKHARKADLRLDQREIALDLKAIVPGRPDDSELVRRIQSDDEDLVMPPPKSHKPLTSVEKELLRRWIIEGAEYQPHWSFISVPREILVPQPTTPPIGFDPPWMLLSSLD